MIKMQYKADKAWACGEERAQISQLASWKPVDWWILLQPNIKHNTQHGLSAGWAWIC